MSSVAASPTRNPLHSVLRVGGLGVIVVSAAFRALTTDDPFPIWSTDPWITFTPGVGLGPTWSVLLDALALLGAAACLLGAGMDRRGPGGAASWIVGACLLGGLAAALAHGAFVAGGSVDNLRLGGAWAAGIAGGVAAWSVARGRLVRIIALAFVLSVLPTLVVKSIGQVTYELPATIENYEATKESFLAARGWEPDGPDARAFERRLSQPNPSAWFAMTNVAAAAFGAGVVIGVGMLADRIRRRREPGVWWPEIVWVLLAAGAAFMLAASGSRAAIGLTMLFAVAAVGMAWLPDRTRKVLGRIALWAGPVSAAALLAFVALRGLAGDAFGERSLLFRWHYAEASARIAADAPLLGVGPEGYQSAYQRAKPPESPEDVASAHNTALDFITTLGLGGWAWTALLFLGLAALSARALAALSQNDDDEPGLERGLRLLPLLAAALPLVAVYTEFEMITPEALLFRVAAAIGAGLVCAAVLAVGVTGRGAAALGAATALGAWLIVLHGFVDVTLVWVNAAPWFGVLIGLAAAPSEARGGHPSAAPGRVSGIALPLGATGCVAGAGLLAFAAVDRLAPWERALRQAGAPFGVLTPIGQMLQGEVIGVGRLGEAAGALGVYLGQPVRVQQSAVGQAWQTAMQRAGADAVEAMARAAALEPGHAGTVRAYGRAAVTFGGAERDPGQSPAFVEAARRLTQLRPASPGAWSWLARAESLGGGDTNAVLEALVRAAEQAPYDWPAAADAAFAALEAGRPEEARAWAEEALRRANLSDLDPLRSPSESERAELEEIVKAP